MRTGFIGLGNMGSAVANLAAENGHTVTGWEHDGAVVREINEHRTNSRYLPDTKMHPGITATDDIGEVFAAAGAVFIAVPSPYIARTLSPLAGRTAPETVIVNMAKGFDPETGKTALGVVSDIFPDNPKVMLSGPAIATEIARGAAAAVVLAGPDAQARALAAGILRNGRFVTAESTDVTGVEMGGILKNIYAIGLGVLDGEGVTSINFRALYLTLALREMTETGVRYGAFPETFDTFAGVGDLFATSLSGHSHNRRFGELLTRHASLDEVRAETGLLPEGCNTVRIVTGDAQRRDLRIPLAEAIARLIDYRLDTREFPAAVLAAAGGKDTR